MSKAIKLACSAVLLAGALAQAHGAIIPIPTRAAFNAMFPGAPLEDFEEANVAAGSFGMMNSPLDSTTNNAIFSAGDIVAGLRLVVPMANNMFVPAAGFANYTSDAISYNSGSTPSPEITIHFLNGDVDAFALDLTSNPNGNTVTVSVFSAGGLEGSFNVLNVQGAGTFFGGIGDGDAITRIELSSNSNFFGVDNIAFAAAVPAPASLALLGIGFLGLGWARRKAE